MPVCEVCGSRFETDGYHVAYRGAQYDSVECALRADAAHRRRGDATAAWVEAARRRMGLAEAPRRTSGPNQPISE